MVAGGASAGLEQTRSHSIYHHAYDETKDNDKQMTPLYRICLTGGPCAGKTTALAQLTSIIEKRGFAVYSVPEAATMLMKAGAMIDNKKMSEEQSENF